MNIIILSADTLRDDYMTMPSLLNKNSSGFKLLLDKGISFTNTYAQSPWIRPSFTSMLSSLYPFQHGVKRRKPSKEHSITIDTTFSPNINWLPEIFQKNGFITCCFQSNVFLSKEFGYSRGFDHYYEKQENIIDSLIVQANNVFRFIVPALPLISYWKSREMIHPVIEWINKNKNEDFFLWINLLDPHAPYSPPLTKIEYVKTISKLFSGKLHGSMLHPIYNKNDVFTEEEKRIIRNRYLHDVMEVDSFIIELTRFLKNIQLMDNTIIIFTSDHGEEFWDHGNQFQDPTYYNRGFDHGHTLYNELIKVPLVLYPARNINLETQSINYLTCHLDIFPTLLNLFNIQYQNDCIEGIDILKKNQNENEMERYVFSHELLYGNQKKAIIYKDLKCIYNDIGDLSEVYNIRKDPHELRNLSESDDQQDTILFCNEKIKIIENDNKSDIENHGVDVSDIVRDKLKSLGYM